MLSLIVPFWTGAGPARASVVCTKTANPSTHAGLQALLNQVRDAGSSDPVACIPSGTYSISFALVIPISMTVTGIPAGTDTTAPVIDCTAASFCFDGSAGPSNVVLNNLSMFGAHKADVQIGTGGGGSTVTGWTLTGITVTGAGQEGIAINNSANIFVSNATITGNGSAPYDPVNNPTGDFGLRANRVDSLTFQDSLVTDNPTTPSPNPGFSGGAKFNTTTNLLVQRNDFTGNAGGGQLWVDISSKDFHVVANTLEEVPTATTGLLPNDAIRVEVSCGGLNGSFVQDNVLTGGVVSAIDLYDSSGITVQHNTITVPQATTPNFGIRMFGNVHDVVPDNGCQQAGAFPDSNNVASGNAIDMTNTGNAVNGVENALTGGSSSGNVWSGDTYTLRHCGGQGGTGQWVWWDGVTNQTLGYADWQGVGQDAGSPSSCTSIYPQVDDTTPFAPPWGPAGTVVTINGSGFTNVTSVKFNHLAAAFTLITDDEMTATVPAGATTGFVCLKNAVNTTCSTANFIVGPVAALTVTRSGTGTGSVTSLAPAQGIDCGTTCQFNFLQGASVTLHAAAAGASTFAGWSGGGCSGTADCTVSMTAAQSVNAQFDLAQHLLTVTKAGNSGGKVTSDLGGIKCPGVCTASYANGSMVVLTAKPAAGSTFAGWSGGACSGTATTCQVTMDADKSVTGTFVPAVSSTTLPDNDPSIAYNGWTGVADPSANGGFSRQSNLKNDLITWTSPAATSLTWITHTGPDQGKASVTIDGIAKGTVDLYAAAPATVNEVYSALPNATHTIVIKVLHAKNPSSSGFSVRLDAFVTGASTTQESDPSITYDTWKSTADVRATDGTSRQAATAKANVTVTFTGTSIDWTTVKGNAYGMAAVTIDGVAMGTVDLYQPATAWGSAITYGGLSAGAHTMVIQVLQLKNASSTSTKVVVDGFVVHA